MSRRFEPTVSLTTSGVDAGFYPCADKNLHGVVQAITHEVKWAVLPNFGLLNGTPEAFATYHIGHFGKDVPALLLPHAGCHMHSDDGSALQHALLYAEAVVQRGGIASCHMLHDGGLTQEFVYGDHPAFRQMRAVMRWGNRKLSYVRRAKVTRLEVAQHHSNLCQEESLYLTAHFISHLPTTQFLEVAETIKNIAGRGKPVLRFINVGRTHAEQIIRRFSEHGIDLPTRFAGA